MKSHRSLGAGASEAGTPPGTRRSGLSPADAGRGDDCRIVSHHKSSSVGILASGQISPEADFTLWRMNIQYIKNV
jgi:hypothetical protein